MKSLIGQIVDTNSAWMGRELNKIGISVKQITSVSDDEDHIIAGIRRSSATGLTVILINGWIRSNKRRHHETNA
jgi:nicotinamide-nucleotide amidase